MKKFLSATLLLSFLFVFSSCEQEKSGSEPEPGDTSSSVALSEVIVGKWLLSTANDREWTVYDFKQSQLMSMESISEYSTFSGTGTFFLNDENASLTATVNGNGNNKYVYLNWIATMIKLNQIDIDIYGGKQGNELVTSSSIYRLVGEQQVEYGASVTPDYRKFAGTFDCSDFKSTNNSAVSVDDDGMLTTNGTGTSFVTFQTPAGRAAIIVTVAEKVLTLAENILGTWVTDVKGYTWERDVFGQDGYFYAQWSREVIFPTTNESAQGSYTVDEANKIISVSAETPYHQKLNVDLHITNMDSFSFDVDTYAYGDKTGVFYYQRVLSSISLDLNQSDLPDYQQLVGLTRITGYATHEEKIATVDPNTGQITAVAEGMTYIDVITPIGTGVVEVEVNSKPTE